MVEFASFLQMSVLLASLAVWGLIIERLWTGEPLVARQVPSTRHRPTLAIVLALGWILYSCLSQLWLSREAPLQRQFNEAKALFLLAFNLAIQVTTTCILLFCLTRLGSQRLTRFGIDGRRFSEDVGLGLLGYLTATIPVMLVMLVMVPFRTPENQHVFLQMLNSQQSVPLVGLMIGSAVVMAPLEEELLFRVIFQGALQRHLPPTASILISATVFSYVHGFPDAVGLFPLALVLGFLYWRTGSYLTVVTTHATFNGVSLVFALISPEV